METEQALWARDQRQEGLWVTARAVMPRVIRQEFLQVQVVALAVEEGPVWVVVLVVALVVEGVRVSGAGESPVLKEEEGLLPGVTTPDITIPRLLSPGQNQTSIYLRTG